MVLEYYLSKVLTYKKEGLIRDLIQKLNQGSLRWPGRENVTEAGVGNQQTLKSWSRNGTLPPQKIHSLWVFPCGPEVTTPNFHCRGHRFDPWSGN